MFASGGQELLELLQATDQRVAFARQRGNLALAEGVPLILLGDRYTNYNIVQLLMPFASTPYRPLLVGLESAYPFDPVHRTLAGFCAGASIPFHDLLPAFRGRRTSELWVHEVDRHPNELAQAIAADALVPVVRGLVEQP